MKLDKLVKQISRDAAANPKKAALLGVMILLALYFWAPLLAGWLGSPKKKTPTGNVDLVLTDDPVDATDKAKSQKAGHFRWEKVHHLIATDPRMKTSDFDASLSSPFASAVREVAAEPPGLPETIDPASAAAAAPEIGPQEAGLVASYVIISPRRRTVMINGEDYREGDKVAAPAKDDPQAGPEFRIVRIERHHVVLERDGRTYTLELSKSELATGDQIQRAKSPTP